MEIEVELVGGLGNQLFGYYAGLYFCKKYKGHLTLNFSNLNRPSHSGSDLRDFYLVEHSLKMNTKNDSPLVLLKKRIRDKSLLEVPISKRLFYPKTELILDTEKFGENPKADKPRILLRGYFGNFQYFKSLSTDLTQLTLREPSSNYVHLANLATRSRPIMLHVRRGDYVTHSDVYGLLSRDYYREALSTAFKSGYRAEIWVFSDDIEAARVLLDGLNGNFRYIEEEYTISPAESLLIQSLGSVNISANSTFSAWASALNNFSALKICPKDYFIDGRTTPNWPPEGMIAIESKWE